MAAALRDKRYTPFFSSRLAETGANSTSRGGGLLTAVSSKYVADHEVLSFTEIVPGKAAALEIRTDGGRLTLINVHQPQAGCSPWAGRAAFWADIQMYATARSLGGRHPVVIAGDTNVYMDATCNPATEHFCAGWEAPGFRSATAGGEEDMTPTLHPSRLTAAEGEHPPPPPRPDKDFVASLRVVNGTLECSPQEGPHPYQDLPGGVSRHVQDALFPPWVIGRGSMTAWEGARVGPVVRRHARPGDPCGTIHRHPAQGMGARHPAETHRDPRGGT